MSVTDYHARLTRKTTKASGLVTCGLMASGLVLLAACGGQSTSRTQSTAADERADAGAVNSDAGAVKSDASASSDASATGSVDHQTSDRDPGTTQGSNTTQTATAVTTSIAGTSAAVTETSMSSGPATTDTMAANSNGETTDPAQNSSVPDRWKPVESPPYGLANCQEQHLFGTDTCGYQLLCDGANISTNCTRSADDEWQCSCQDTSAQKLETYTLSDIADANTPCPAGISFCVPGHEPELEVTCSLVEREPAFTSACTSDHVCVGTGELPGGVKTRQTSVEATRLCFETTLGFECRCGLNDSPVSRIVAPEPNDACVAVHEQCTDNLEWSDEPYCTEPKHTASELECSIEWTCGAHAEPEDDVHVFSDVFSTLGVSCVLGEDSLFVCTSWANGFVQSAYVEADQPEAACQTMQLLDATEPVFEPTGDVDCPPPTRVYPETPTVYAGVCTQAVEAVDQGSLTLGGDLVVECLPDGDAWECHCRSNGSVSQFGATGDDPDAVTVAAFDECASRAQLTVRDQTLGFEFPE